MKTLFGLYGRANVGKTQTLKSLMNLFYKENGETENIVEVVPNSDLYRVIEYKGKRICIATGGDNMDIVEENCKKFKEDSFDIAVTATRSKGKVDRFIMSLTKKEDLNLKWLEKGTSYNLGDKYEKIIIKNNADILFQCINDIILHY